MFDKADLVHEYNRGQASPQGQSANGLTFRVGDSSFSRPGVDKVARKAADVEDYEQVGISAGVAQHAADRRKTDPRGIVPRRNYVRRAADFVFGIVRPLTSPGLDPRKPRGAPEVGIWRA